MCIPSLLPPCRWGEFIKKKGALLHCKACSTWVGWSQLNLATTPPKREMDTDGFCPHYDDAPHARLRRALDAVTAFSDFDKA